MKNSSLGNFILNRRKELGLSLKDIADSLNVSASTIYKWEKNERIPDLYMIGDLCKILKISIEGLVDGKFIQDNKYENERFNIDVFSKNFSIIRKLKGYSLVSLAKELEISYQTISKWERAESLPNIYVLKNCAQLFGITLTELYYGKSSNLQIQQRTKKKKVFKISIIVSIIAITVLLSSLIPVLLNNDESSRSNQDTTIENSSSVIESSSSKEEQQNSNSSNDSSFLEESSTPKISDTSTKESSSPEESLSSEDTSSSENDSTIEDSALSFDFTDYDIETSIEGIKIIEYFGRDKEIALPEGVYCIGENAFESNPRLKKVELPSTVTTIEYAAFSSCQELEYISLPEGLKYIGENAFSGSYLLDSIELSDNIEFLGAHAFSNCWNLSSINIPKKISSIEYGTFYECRNLKKIEIPSNVKRICSHSFEGCVLLEEVYICDGLEIIELQAFNYCPALTKVRIPDSVMEVGTLAFQDCSNECFSEYDNGYYVGNENNQFLVYVKPKNTNKNIKINENTKVVVGDSFRDFGTIESIYIPESVSFIGYYLTNGKIKNIYYEGTKQQWDQIKIDENNEFLLAAAITYEYKI